MLNCVPFVVPGLSASSSTTPSHTFFHHLHHWILYLTPNNTPKIQHPKELEVRVRSYRETRCINQQKPKTKIQMKDAKKYNAIYYMNCRIGCRSTERIFSHERIPLEPRRNPEPGYRDTANSSHELPIESRAKVEPGSGRQCLHALCEGPKLRYLLEDAKNKSLQKTHLYSRAQSGKFWWLDNCKSQYSQWRKWIEEQSSTCRAGTRFGNAVVTILPVQHKKLHRRPSKNQMKFPEPNRKPKVTYTDNSLEFGKSCEESSWNLCTSTPHRSETIGIAERAVRRVKEGTLAVLLQSGLDEKWWAGSMECYCYVRNIQDLLSDGKSPCESRFGMVLNGSVKSFRAMHPRYISRLCIVRGRNLERRHYNRSQWRIEGDGRIRTPLQKAQCKGSVNANKRW